MTILQKDQLENRILTLDILIPALYSIESEIDKAAYTEKRFRNYDLGTNKQTLRLYIGYRKTVTDLIIKYFNLEEKEIKNMVRQIDKKIVSFKSSEKIVELIRSNSYTLG